VGKPDGFALAVHAHGVVRAFELHATGTRRGGFAGLIDSIRRRAQGALAHGLPPPQAGLLRGMVLGDDTALPATTRAEFRASGLSHLMAASGQNVVLLVALTAVLARFVGLSFGVRWAVVAGLITMYVPLAGGGPSIQRAGVMGAIGVLALVSARPVARGYALMAAAAATLALDPRAVTDAGWQMSFAAVVALLLLAQPWGRRLHRAGIPRPLAEALAVTAAATVATAPIVAAHFGRASPVTLPANIIAAPVVAPIMWLGLLAAAIGQLLPALANPLDLAAAPLLGFLTWVAHVAATAPGASLKAGVFPVSAVCAAVIVVAGRARHTRPARLRPVLIALSLAALLPAITGSGRLSAPLPPPGRLRVTFLDVGQGDATLLQDGAAAVLVDTGPPGAPIVALLRHAGITKLDALVVTHAQSDHDGGAAAVLDDIPVGIVLDGRDGIRSAEGDAFATDASRHHVGLQRPRAGTVLRAGRLALKVLNPGPGASSAATGEDPNRRAIVLELHDRGATVLLTADAESDVLSSLPIGHVDILKVSHHGSADPGLPALLQRLRPQIAVIEVGKGNTYGHPVAATVAALQAVSSVYRTDTDGTIRADLDGSAWVLHAHS
jgi:competence protein ComEC